MTSKYRKDLDILKGLAIISIVLYHLGILKSGYLGVDIFFVINGYFVIPSIIRDFLNGTFSFINFIKHRLIRLFPLIVVSSFVALTVGYFIMLPDDYENLSQSSIASIFMSGNILSSITARSYWDIANEYKPLMHLWYVGVLFESYLVLPLLLFTTKWICKIKKLSFEKSSLFILCLISAISLIFYILPFGSVTEQFYLLHYRLFEIGIGGISGIIAKRVSENRHISVLQDISFGTILIIVFCSLYYAIIEKNIYTGGVIGKTITTYTGIPIHPKIALILTVTLTSAISLTNNGIILSKLTFLSHIGKLSYSIFIWHQLIIAFCRYSITNKFNIFSIIILLTIISIISIISYFSFEKCSKVSHYTTKYSTIVLTPLTLICSTLIYINSGVVRDVPELDIDKSNVHKGMFSEYCDRVFQYKEYSNDIRKTKVLVVGVSYGRDFSNILLESKYRDSIDLVYGWKWSDESLKEKIKECDYVFSFSSKEEVPSYVWENKKNNCIVMGISTKNFGSCNGIVYKNRGSTDYFAQTVELLPGYKELNEDWKKTWGKDYIDLLSMVLVDNEHVRVFTDNNKFISQDCYHLTKAGAQWYADNIYWPSIFSNK